MCGPPRNRHGQSKRAKVSDRDRKRKATSFLLAGFFSDDAPAAAAAAALASACGGVSGHHGALSCMAIVRGSARNRRRKADAGECESIAADVAGAAKPGG
jgi:hypothetical protein